MRIYSNPKEAVREVERDLFEMGIHVHPQTMQDKAVGDNPDYDTIELQGFGYKITGYQFKPTDVPEILYYIFRGVWPEFPRDHWDFPQNVKDAHSYIVQEDQDRWSGAMMNPGRAWQKRREVWQEFLHDGKFAYTYSERFTPQVGKIASELVSHPDTRQAIVNVHSNICPTFEIGTAGARVVQKSADLDNTGGKGRIPCSMYYQFMRRNSALDLIYTMRSCDLLVHYPIDLMLALMAQKRMADYLSVPCGTFTHFIGSLHAYKKDMNKRGIF